MTLKEILEVCNGEFVSDGKNINIKSFSTDTRTIKKGDCFVALKGPNYDGTSFIKEAFKKGASVCIVDKDITTENGNAIVKVENTYDALKKLAKYKRDKSDIPVIAITGSNGKTTTKDMIANTLSKKYKVLKTSLNNNNVIGMSKTILSLKNEDILVLEMGMNHMHEIEEMSYIASPNIAIITNIGLSHIGNLKTKKNVLKAKLEIVKYLKKDGVVIINNDDEMLSRWKNKKYDTIKFGIESKSDYNIKKLKTIDNKYIFDIEQLKNIKIPLTNKVILYSVLCTYIIGTIFNIKDSLIKKSIETFKLPEDRCEIINRKKITIINDTYNASYESMKSSINYLSTYSGRKIAVLGDMLELGHYSRYLHKLIKEELIKNKIDIVITVGNYSKYISDNLTNSYHYKNIEDAIKKINKIKKSGDVILVKASHKMNLKEIVNQI